MSAVVTILVHTYMLDVLTASLAGYSVSLNVGILKELIDSTGRGTEDIGGIYADTIGSLVGTVIACILIKAVI